MVDAKALISCGLLDEGCGKSIASYAARIVARNHKAIVFLFTSPLHAAEKGINNLFLDIRFVADLVM